MKRQAQRLPAVAFVADDWPNTQVRQDLTNILQTTARDRDVISVFFAAADNAWLVVGREAHGLRLIELRILEGRHPQQPVSKAGSQPRFGDVDLVAKDEFKRLREVANNRQLLSAS